MPRQFRTQESQDFKIEEAGGPLVGHVRIKPNAILWKEPNDQQYYKVTLDEFRQFAIRLGVLVDR